MLKTDGFGGLAREGGTSCITQEYIYIYIYIKGRGMVSGLFEKKRDAIPPHPAPPQALPLMIRNYFLFEM
jgi:hypothetical protein